VGQLYGNLKLTEEAQDVSLSTARNLRSECNMFMTRDTYPSVVTHLSYRQELGFLAFEIEWVLLVDDPDLVCCAFPARSKRSGRCIWCRQLGPCRCVRPTVRALRLSSFAFSQSPLQRVLRQAQ
jgi:hypothetical protein